MSDLYDLKKITKWTDNIIRLFVLEVGPHSSKALLEIPPQSLTVGPPRVTFSVKHFNRIKKLKLFIFLGYK